MLWEIEIRPRGHDAERQRVCEEYRLLTHARDGAAPTVRRPSMRRWHWGIGFS